MENTEHALYRIVRRAKNMSAWLDSLKLFSKSKPSPARQSQQGAYLRSIIDFPDAAHTAACVIGRSAITFQRTHVEQSGGNETLDTLLYAFTDDAPCSQDMLLRVREYSDAEHVTILSYDHILDILLLGNKKQHNRFGTTFIRLQDTWGMYLILWWMGKHDMLQSLLRTINMSLQPVVREHMFYSSTVQHIILVHLLSAWETAMHEQSIQDGVPWEWQESVVAHQVYTHLANTDALQHLVHTLLTVDQA